MIEFSCQSCKYYMTCNKADKLLVCTNFVQASLEQMEQECEQLLEELDLEL